MKTEWSLDILYKGLDDPAYEADIKKLADAVAAMKETVSGVCAKEGEPETADVERTLTAMEQVLQPAIRLLDYLQLSQSVNTEDGNLMAQINRVMQYVTQFSPLESAAKKYFAQIRDVDAMAENSEIVKAYTFLLKECREESKHLFDDAVEEMVSSMELTGAKAWGDLFSYMTSTVKVAYDGKEITLPEVRNLAYSPDAAVRKEAYEAELHSYESIADAVAFALNNIKSQVTMLSAKRGYESPLAESLAKSKMSRATLDAMMQAIKEYLPVFRKYLRKKAEMLGHTNGLPWYDLFAPVGASGKTYTIEEAEAYLLDCFGEFAPEMRDLMQDAFAHEWIDFYPKKGKEGGAFCAGIAGEKQSRILTNYDGSFSAVGTLAHELGHAFHNRQLEDERLMNQDYPMPVAETASTFNEVHLGKYALKRATGQERLHLLDNDLREQTQCVVDIYSRYLFETAVFEQGKEKFLMKDDLKALMLDAQKQAYGDGLDEDVLHPYMWTCKSHYYNANCNFYNFPYAFGNLFALGLYAKFLEQGADFVPEYRAMLRATPCCTIEEAGKMAGVDLTDVNFWRKSLAMIEESVEEFCKF